MSKRLKFAFWGASTLIVGSVLTGCSSTAPVAAKWPAWEGFKSAYLSDDGRVIDRSQEDLRTVSEGQAYAMFFALVAADRAAFDDLLTWTENNLSDGDIGKTLPAWQWGKKADGWGVIDSNSASDADLWIAYALLEASRVWCEPAYARKARALGNLILKHETLEVSGLGLSVLPGKQGFVRNDGAVKLNPSYVPSFLMARLANAWADEGRWSYIYLASQRLLLDTGRTGSYPDWVLYNNGELSLPADEQRGDYDAIRTYLWIGMNSPQDPLNKVLIAQLQPAIQTLISRKHMPEWFEPFQNTVAPNRGPRGFQVSAAPLLKAAGHGGLAEQFMSNSLTNADKALWLDYGYYNGALNLFGTGFMENRYQFNALGELLLNGNEVKACE